MSASQEPLDHTTLTSSSIMIHPNFTAKSLKNDIAIIKLPSAVPLGQLPTIGSVCLPSKMIFCLIDVVNIKNLVLNLEKLTFELQKLGF